MTNKKRLDLWEHPHHCDISNQVKNWQSLIRLLIMGKCIALIKCIEGNGEC